MTPRALVYFTQFTTALGGSEYIPLTFVAELQKRCRVTLENGGLTREIAFYPYDALHDAMAVDGVYRYFVSAAKVQSLLTAP